MNRSFLLANTDNGACCEYLTYQVEQTAHFLFFASFYYLSLTYLVYQIQPRHIVQLHLHSLANNSILLMQDANEIWH
jgi:hypothetical protein